MGRVENVERRSGGRRSQWTKVLETSEGRGVRADYRCLSSAEDERYVWEQELEGTPFARHLRSSRIEIGLREAGGGDRGRPRSVQTLNGMSRLGSPMMRRGQGAILDEALDGIEGADVSGWRVVSLCEQVDRAGDDSAAAGLEVVGVGGPRGLRRSSTRRRWRVLRERIGELEAWPLAARLEDFALPAPEPLPAALTEAVGAGGDLHRGRGPAAACATAAAMPTSPGCRGGSLETAPDAVVMPADAEALRRVLDACATEGVAVVPVRRRHQRRRRGRAAARRALAADQPRPRRPARGRRRPPLAHRRLGAGLRGPEAEAALGREGLTLGHFPQSFEYATIGGFAATRSAGQASSGYGRFDSLVSSVRLLAPAGDLRTLETPHTAAGPALRELVVGSEGVLGVIPEVTVRVRPAPATRRYEAWMAESFEAGAEIVRALAQGPGLPDVVRVSDEEETEGSLALSGPRGAAGRLFDGYLGLRRRRGGCLTIVGFEGEEEAVARRRALAVRELRAAAPPTSGRPAGRSWEHGRYQGPYLRDTLMEMGAMVETLETSHTWSRLGELHDAVAAAIHGSLAGQGTPGLVFCHLSHAYADGASLYFTFIARRRHGAELEQWGAVKRAACEAIVAGGGTITHHHAVGRDHAPYMEAEVGGTGLDVLRAVKDQLDPTGIMNPGKLLG